MQEYRLDDLGWAEFERLVQALLKARLGFGIEAWGGERGDWGRDAYFEGDLVYPSKAVTTGAFVFQSKFVEGANAAGSKPEKALLAAIRKECDRLLKRFRKATCSSPRPTVYALFTNAALTPTIRGKVDRKSVV